MSEVQFRKQTLWFRLTRWLARRFKWTRDCESMVAILVRESNAEWSIRTIMAETRFDKSDKGLRVAGVLAQAFGDAFAEAKTPNYVQYSFRLPKHDDVGITVEIRPTSARDSSIVTAMNTRKLHLLEDLCTGPDAESLGYADVLNILTMTQGELGVFKNQFDRTDEVVAIDLFDPDYKPETTES